MDQTFEQIKTKFEVIENNAGGLTLFTFDQEGKAVYAHTGYEYYPGSLMEDLKMLEKEDPITDHWDGNVNEVTPQELYEEIVKGEPFNWNIIADNSGLYPDRMGSYAKYEFRIPEDGERQRIFIDMDGTLAKFRQVDQLETLYEQGYFRNLEPMPNVIAAVKEIVLNHPEKEVYIMSAVLSDSRFAREEKNAWLDQYLPEIDSVHRVFPPCGDNKLEYVPGGIRETDYLLDDYTKNLVLWEPPAKGIKLLNGINHTRGTWKGSMLRYDRNPSAIARNIVDVMDGIRISEKMPLIREQKRVPNGPKL